MHIYAGIGSRQTPPEVLSEFYAIASRLSCNGWMLRSGGARGADSAFQSGSSRSEIYTAGECTEDAEELSSKFHPNWGACSQFARKLHGRNAMIVLGASLDEPVDMVVCWTPGGRTSGGTGQAIRIAKHYNIPIFNFGDAGSMQNMADFVTRLTGKTE